jgi:hypothetical protein
VTQTFTKRSSDSKEKCCTDNSKLNSQATKKTNVPQRKIHKDRQETNRNNTNMDSPEIR